MRPPNYCGEVLLYPCPTEVAEFPNSEVVSGGHHFGAYLTRLGTNLLAVSDPGGRFDEGTPGCQRGLVFVYEVFQSANGVPRFDLVAAVSDSRYTGSIVGPIVVDAGEWTGDSFNEFLVASSACSGDDGCAGSRASLLSIDSSTHDLSVLWSACTFFNNCESIDNSGLPDAAADAMIDPGTPGLDIALVEAFGTPLEGDDKLHFFGEFTGSDFVFHDEVNLANPDPNRFPNLAPGRVFYDSCVSYRFHEWSPGEGHFIRARKVVQTHDDDGDGVVEVLLRVFRASGTASIEVFSVNFAASEIHHERTVPAPAGVSEAWGTYIAAVDLWGDSAPEIVVGDPRSCDTGFEGRVYIYETAGPNPWTLTTVLDGPSVAFKLEENTEFGFSLAAAGDLTGDGKDELLVGAPALRPLAAPNSYQGRVWVYSIPDPSSDPAPLWIWGGTGQFESDDDLRIDFEGGGLGDSVASGFSQYNGEVPALLAGAPLTTAHEWCRCDGNASDELNGASHVFPWPGLGALPTQPRSFELTVDQFTARKVSLFEIANADPGENNTRIIFSRFDGQSVVSGICLQLSNYDEVSPLFSVMNDGTAEIGIAIPWTWQGRTVVYQAAQNTGRTSWVLSDEVF
ncbi:MAG: integrin alpha [Phycisphaerales bacterium]